MIDLNKLMVGEILVVDDTPANLKLLTGLLVEEGYKVRPASDGAQAIRAMLLRPADLILLDIKMPDMDGYQVCQKLKQDERFTDVPIIFISALDSLTDRIRGFEVGGVDYITKPFQREEVLARVKTHIQLRKSQQNLEALVFLRTEQIHNTLLQTIKAIALTVEKRDPYTSGHQQRVSDLAVAIANKMDLDIDTVEGIRLGAIIHDLGKVYIPSEILNRPGKLNPTEFELIKTHSQVGYDIVKDVEFPWPVATMILQHHERMDGSGYPVGVSGDQILLESRIIAVADVVEAMASHRPYRPSMGLDKALQEIKDHKGTLYDADVVDACVRLFETDKYSLS